MAKFDVTIWYTVSYTHNTEVDAKTYDEAREKANEIFENANVTADWGYDGGDLEIDIDEMEDDQ